MQVLWGGGGLLHTQKVCKGGTFLKSRFNVLNVLNA
jgi:hypothetical protein